MATGQLLTGNYATFPPGSSERTFSMSYLRRLFATFVAIVHMLTFCLLAVATPAAAQTPDSEPPVIDFERLNEGVQGDTQAFSAMVTDDRGVDRVTLFYRLDPQSRYESTSMISLAGTSIYTATVPTAGVEATVLQYYIEARDSAGNRSIQGFAFDPIERQLVPPGQPLAAAPAVDTAPAPIEPGISTGRKVLYGVLGVLALGAIAAAAGGSGGGGGGPSADDPGTIPLTITVDPL